MIVIGLTGSIAMGKSTVTKQFAYLGARTFNSDTAVHEILEKNSGAISEIKKRFPDAVKNKIVDRKALGKIVFHDDAAMHELEAIMHPRVWEMQQCFLRRCALQNCGFAVLDIPLLFETNGEENVDVTVVVSAPKFVQRQRALLRMHMTEERFDSILKKQMPDIEKRRRADFVIHTGLGKAYSMRQVRELMTLLTSHRDP